MKKIILILISILFLGIILSNAQNVNVDLTVKFNGAIKSDSVYLFFYPTTSIELGQRLPKPDKKLVIHELKSTFQIYPGAYTLGVLAFGSKPLNTRIYIPPFENFRMELELNPLIIGQGGITSVEQINKVVLREDFKVNEKKGEIPLLKKGNVWKLEKKPEDLQDGKRYTFFVNEQQTTDLLNPKVLAYSNWLKLKNVYSNNEIVFDPSLYSMEYKESELLVADTMQQYQFKEFIKEVNGLEIKERPLLKNWGSPEKTALSIDSLIKEYSLLSDKYPKDISQISLEKELGLRIFENMVLTFSLGNPNDSESKEKKKEYLSGKEFEVKITKIKELINKLDPNSFLLKGEFVSSFPMMQNLLKDYPDIQESYNLPYGYFDEFIEKFIKESPNKKLCYNILLKKAVMSQFRDEEKSIELLNNLKNDAQYAEFINDVQINRILSQMNIKLGKIAPNFTVELLNGKKISLSDYQGKYVFIDFWGSWCGPCKIEIPYIKKFYNSISRDKLEIIGLAQDKEPELREYIKNKKIEYPNALAPKELLAKYGIRGYPTSFLINPKGKIVRMNVRGESTFELIKEEIENYFN